MPAAQGDSERVVIRRPRLLTFAPRYEERIDPEFYRYAGKVRFIATWVLMLGNLAAYIQAGRLGYDADFFAKLQFVNTPGLLVSSVLAWVMWKGGAAPDTLRRLNLVCATLECASTLGAIWMFGSVSSHMIVFGMLLVLVYRAFFTFDTGLYVFLLLLVGHWTIVLLEFFGALPYAPGYAARQVSYTPDAITGAMFVISVMLFVTFYTANLVVQRLHNKELAIRILRENLAAVEPGNVGRHTGRTLSGTYQLGRLLGTGGMGEVYEGKHRRTRRPVAVKLLHPQLLDDPALLRRFRREAEITGSLGSPHIVEIIDIDQDDDQPFIVFELLEGQSLADYISSQGVLDLDDVADIFAQVAKGLQSAHDAGVIHRDLKPANIFLVDRDGHRTAKILDFGVSKIQGQATALTREFALLGTPDYMSPEQTLGMIDDVDAQADVFALGAIAYHAVTGTKPFIASSVPALLRRVCDEEPIPVRKFRPDLPEDVEHVIAIAMAKKPEERYESVAELARDFRAAVGGALPEAVRERAARVHRGAPSSRSHSTVTDGIAVEDTAAAARGDTMTYEE